MNEPQNPPWTPGPWTARQQFHAYNPAWAEAWNAKRRAAQQEERTNG